MKIACKLAEGVGFETHGGVAPTAVFKGPLPYINTQATLPARCANADCVAMGKHFIALHARACDLNEAASVWDQTLRKFTHGLSPA